MYLRLNSIRLAERRSILVFIYSSDIQIFSNYGPKTNEAFLFSYGFIVPNNPNSTLWVQLGLRNEDPFLEKKKSLLAKYNLGSALFTYEGFLLQLATSFQL